ncbi:MAG: hypothetical protein H7A51_19350 [Akkermansiaceae bacterium]|nr:hypothetical protein [Akkermansiaceae bacterium]
MKAKQLTHEYIIDISLPENERWNEVIHHEKTIAKSLVKRSTLDTFGANPHDLTTIVRAGMKFFNNVYALTGGHYHEEINAWSKGTGISKNLITFLNCQYELSQLCERKDMLGQNLPSWLRKTLRLGCTAGAVRVAKDQTLHVRNMDWPLESMGRASRIFRFKEGDREFVTVGVPGMVGVLSGMLPGAYSATINYAPPTITPGFDFGPLFLLRHVFETCDTYQDACYALSHTRLSANVLFTVCSASGQACLIERTRKEFSRRNMRNGVLGAANHYRTHKFSHHNDLWDDETIEDSMDRVSSLEGHLSKSLTQAPLARIASSLDYHPVLNSETRQQMIFNPASGEYLVWTR